MGTLRFYARNVDRELRVVDGGNGQKEIQERPGSWSGRLMRNLKINLGGEDRGAKQAEYMGAKEAVLKALTDIYGEKIGEQAFRAGVGRLADDGEWETSSNHPLTGRHIAKMLEKADTLRNAHLADWIDDRRGEPIVEGRARLVELGDKVSVPMEGKQPIGEVCASIATDLESDAEKVLGDNQHGFWILDLTSPDGDSFGIGLHIDRENPHRVEVLGAGGEGYPVERGRLGEFLNGYIPTRFESGLASVALHRAEHTVPEPKIEIIESDSEGSQPKYIGGLGKDDKKIEIIEINDVPVPKFKLEGDRRVANVHHLMLDDWVGITTRNDERLEREHGRTEEGFEDLKEIRVGDGYDTVELGTEQRQGLSRFMNDSMFLDAYVAMTRRLGLDPPPSAQDVEVAIEARRNETGEAEGFDITFRARLPEGVSVPTGDEPVPGRDCDLTMTIEVPYDQINSREPDFKIRDARIEIRQ